MSGKRERKQPKQGKLLRFCLSPYVAAARHRCQLSGKVAHFCWVDTYCRKVGPTLSQGECLRALGHTDTR